MAEEIGGDVVKEKRKLLGFFCTVVQVIGWLLVLGGVMWFIYLLSGSDKTSGGREVMVWVHAIISWFSYDFVFIGFAAVILAQLSRYVFDKEYQLKIMLRCGDKILYLFAALTILWAVFQWFFFVKTVEPVEWRILLAQPLILPTVAKVLILVCLGQILKRIIPVIEEYKTLV